MSERLTLNLRGWDDIDERHHGVSIGVSPAEFWSALTPTQAMALLRVAPKVAGPWVRASTDPAYGAQRCGPMGRVVATVNGRMFSFAPVDTRNWITFASEGGLTASDGVAQTFAEGCVAADAALVAAGWVLVNEPAGEEG